MRFCNSFRRWLTNSQKGNQDAIQNISLEDLLQESYLCMYDAIYLWNPNSSQLSTYIHVLFEEPIYQQGKLFGNDALSFDE
jgi:DNA-directed RNA polymerase specialized sigma24 family protein